MMIVLINVISSFDELIVHLIFANYFSVLSIIYLDAFLFSYFPVDIEQKINAYSY